MQEYIRIHPEDNVAVALTDLPPGKVLEFGPLQVTLLQSVPRGHKIALSSMEKDAPVIKYGNPIGYTKEAVSPGAWMHTHNIRTGLSDVIEYTYHPVETDILPGGRSTFMGYRRRDGKVGVRNELWIIPTVGCVNNIAQTIERIAKTRMPEGIDDIVSFPHPYGCSQMGDDQENTRRILANMITHPNAGGVLVLGLGCENSGIGVLKEYLGSYDDRRVRFLECQAVADEIEEGLALFSELTAYAALQKREPIDASELIIGLKCGGSDGLSGITANPVVGAFSDILISRGGTSILTEVPEMFGAEKILMNRCADERLFDDTVKLINDFKMYFKEHGKIG